MTETLLRALAEAGAPSVTAPPYLAERVLARSRRRRRTVVAAVLAVGAVGASVAARSGGHSRYFDQYEPSGSMGRTVAAGEFAVADRQLKPEDGDLVVVKVAGEDGSYVTVRRVLGLSGDVISCPAGADGRCHGWVRNGARLVEPYADGDDGSVVAPVLVGAGEMYLLGDQRDNAVDSRRYPAPARLDAVLGVVVRVKDQDGHLRAVPGAPAHPGPDGSNIDPSDGPPPAHTGP